MVRKWGARIEAMDGLAMTDEEVAMGSFFADLQPRAAGLFSRCGDSVAIRPEVARA
jgi:hypothetical protein